MIANYHATAISIDRHPLALLREQLSADGALSTADLANGPPRVAREGRRAS